MCACLVSRSDSLGVQTVSKNSAAKKKADRLTSAIVRSRGFCENCGERDYRKLQAAHIISRRYSATRCDLANILALCSGCHLRFTEWPLEFAEFVVGYIGESEYQLLVAKSLTYRKVDWEEECVRLTALLKEVAP